VSHVPDPRRWIAGDGDVPAELRDLLRAARDELGTVDEVAELARRLSADLGPAAGLSGGAALDRSEPAARALGGAQGVMRVAAHRLGRWGAWLVAGGSAATALWLVASSWSSQPRPEPSLVVRDGSASAAREAEKTPGIAPAAPALPAPAEVPLAPVGAAQPEVAQPPEAQDPPGADHGRARGASTSSRRAPVARASRSSPALAEASLLDRAQAALGSDPAAALTLTREHQRRFPRGVLAEEREVIAIEALQRLGRREAASARALAFERRYHGSVHRPRLERSTATSSPAEGDLNTER
jgi:hypothetical protein